MPQVVVERWSGVHQMGINQQAGQVVGPVCNCSPACCSACELAHSWQADVAMAPSSGMDNAPSTHFRMVLSHAAAEGSHAQDGTSII